MTLERIVYCAFAATLLAAILILTGCAPDSQVVRSVTTEPAPMWWWMIVGAP
jgi:uncharacterized lipoprotein YajG